MANGRFISTSIATDKRLAGLTIEAEYLFLKTIPHLDRDGLILADPLILWARVCPRRPALMDHVADLLKEWEDAELVTPYETADGRAMLFAGFTKNQAGMRYGREAASKIDPPPGHIRTHDGIIPQAKTTEKAAPPTNSGSTPAVLRQSDGVCRAEDQDQDQDQSDDDDRPAQPAILDSSSQTDPTPPPVSPPLAFGATTSDWVSRLHESVFQVIGPLNADAIRGFPAKYPRAWIEEAYRRAATELAKPGKRIGQPGSYLTAILESMYTSGLTGQGTYNDQNQQTNHAGLAAFGQKPGNHSGSRHGTNGRAPTNQSALGTPLVFANDTERLEFEELVKDITF